MAGTDEKLTGLLDALENAVDGSSITLGQLVEAMGERSFAAVLLVPALIMVSPISGIPGSPTIAGTLFALVSAQMLMGRSALWLPGFLQGLSIRADRLGKAIDWLRKPARWIDPVIRERMTILTDRPASYGAMLCCLGIAATMPPMEFLPFAASFASGAVALFATGLMARDGALILLGYATVAGLVALVLRLV